MRTILYLSFPSINRSSAPVGATLEIFPPENKKQLFGSTYPTKRNKKASKQAKLTEQLGKTPKSLIFNFDAGNQNARRGQHYPMLPSCSPGFSNIVAYGHRLCMPLR
jgi:hypothetical protein